MLKKTSELAGLNKKGKIEWDAVSEDTDDEGDENLEVEEEDNEVSYRP